VQSFHILLVGAGLLLTSQAQRYIPAWPAHVAKLAVNAAGVGLFVAVARLIVSQQESAGALAKAEADAQVAALQALRRRLEPHFLFNALNAVRATIRRDPDKARELVADLSDLYRYLLTHPEDAELGAEVEHAASYLAIERVRLGEERVHVVLEIGDDAKRVRVPSLLIQPLVENAVKHGLARHEGAGTITVRASLQDTVLVIEVRDESEGAVLPPISEPQAKSQRGEPTGEGAHVALATLRERLTRRFGQQASLTLEQREHGASQVIRIPLDRSTISGASGESAPIDPPLTSTRRESA